MIRKRFGDAIRQQALEALIQEAYKEAIEREQLKPAAQPHVHDVKFNEGEPLTFELHLEVRPEVQLPRDRRVPCRAASTPVRTNRSTTRSSRCASSAPPGRR